MKLLVKETAPASEKKFDTEKQNQRDPVKQELRRRIYEALEAASNLPVGDRAEEIRFRLFAIQNYCKTVGKTFIVVEQQITCDQFDLGGRADQTATLFRGPNQDASVAICITQQGSLLHRTSCPWEICINEGDIDPVIIFNSLELVNLPI